MVKGREKQPYLKLFLSRRQLDLTTELMCFSKLNSDSKLL